MEQDDHEMEVDNQSGNEEEEETLYLVSNKKNTIFKTKDGEEWSKTPPLLSRRKAPNIIT